MNMSKEDSDALERLREYLKIPSVHPDVDYGPCVEFLRGIAADLDLPLAVYEVVAKKPVVVITWEGSEPDLPTILLNSHMDVVPVYEEFWTHPPFSAHLTDDGWVYARGVQDMKSVGMMHLETLRRLKGAGVRLKRTVHVSFVPDEEIGGTDGMGAFSQSEHFKKLNVGFSLDESAANPKPSEIYAFHAERTARQIKVTCRGTPDHGSTLRKGTAGEKIHYIIDKFMTYRAEELRKFECLGSNREMLGGFTSINLTLLAGGVQINVLPEVLSVGFDIRIAPDADHEAFENMIERWCTEAGEGVAFEYLVKNPVEQITNITDGSSPFWGALVKTVEEMGLKVNCIVCPGTTDARYLRRLDIPAINFSPIYNSPILIHCHDERLHKDAFFNGIRVMENVVRTIANVEENS